MYHLKKTTQRCKILTGQNTDTECKTTNFESSLLARLFSPDSPPQLTDHLLLILLSTLLCHMRDLSHVLVLHDACGVEDVVVHGFPPAPVVAWRATQTSQTFPHPAPGS